MVNKLFTRAEVAYIFKVCKETVRLWEKRGLISTTGSLGTKPRYSIEEVERLQGNIKQAAEKKIIENAVTN